MPRWNEENRTPLGKVRANAGFSIEKAAVTINISSHSLLRYENGITDLPLRIAEKLCNLYKVPFETIRQAIKETPLKRERK